MTSYMDSLLSDSGAVDEQVRFWDLLHLDREAAVLRLSAMVRRSSVQELDLYERHFLRQVALLVKSPTLQVRAAELYAYLKLEEYQRYQSFRGFCDEKPAS